MWIENQKNFRFAAIYFNKGGIIVMSPTDNFRPNSSPHMSVDNAVIQCLSPGYHFPTHLHHTVELFICVSGEVTVTILGNDIRVTPGEYFVYFPDIPHSITITGSSSCTFYQMHFHSRPFSEVTFKQNSLEESAFSFELSLGKRKYIKAQCNPQLEACVNGIYTEMQSGLSDSDKLVQLYLAQLNIFLSREVIATNTSGFIHQNRYLLNASLFISENYMKKLTVQDVAEAAGISPRYLTKLFNENFDMGVSAYITHVRISKAIDFMYTNPKYPLTKLALDMGFSSQQHFSKVFKEKMSVSPKRYFSLQLNNQ